MQLLLYFGLPFGFGTFFGLRSIAAMINKDGNYRIWAAFSAIAIGFGMMMLAGAASSGW